MTRTHPSTTRKEMAAFLGLTFGVSLVFYWLILTSKSLAEGQPFIPGLMWAPGLGALAAGEEIGWRGFLVPALARTRATHSST